MPNDGDTPRRHNGFDGGINIVEVARTADRAMNAIEFHSAECDKRQVRIEKAQDEIKYQVRSLDTKLSKSSSDLHAKIELFSDNLDTKINEIHIKMAKITSVILFCAWLIKQAVEWAVEHSAVTIEHLPKG